MTDRGLNRRFLKADNTCTPSGFNTAARATCANGVPSVTLFTNDQGTCTSSTNSSFPTSCHSVVGPGPFGGSITMGFGMACQTYAPENLLEVTVYSGNCNSKTDPMVTFMLLNTCLTPPGIPIAGTIANPPGSFLMRDFGTANKVLLRVEVSFCADALSFGINEARISCRCGTVTISARAVQAG